MIEKLKCPKCSGSSFAWEGVPHRNTVEKAIRKEREPKLSSSTSDPAILYCVNCGYIVKTHVSAGTYPVYTHIMVH
ncbi:MAG: hypothetical protein ACFFDI_21935 [Promethearchaeota archaeon]